MAKKLEYPNKLIRLRRHKGNTNIIPAKNIINFLSAYQASASLQLIINEYFSFKKKKTKTIFIILKNKQKKLFHNHNSLQFLIIYSTIRYKTKK